MVGERGIHGERCVINNVKIIRMKAFKKILSGTFRLDAENIIYHHDLHKSFSVNQNLHNLNRH